MIGAQALLSLGTLDQRPRRGKLPVRLTLPAALFTVCSNAHAAVPISLVVFGGMHANQGIGGVIGTFDLGAILMFLFLVTGHPVADRRAAALRPALARTHPGRGVQGAPKRGLRVRGTRSEAGRASTLSWRGLLQSRTKLSPRI